MALFSLIVLAIVQGITEFLPISSSGHLIIVDEISTINSNLAIDVMLHMGTLLAILIYYREQVVGMAEKAIKLEESKLLKNIVISSIPAVAAVLLLGDALESDARTIGVVMFMLFAIGLIMLFEKRILPKNATKKLEDLTPKDALGIGFAQSIALIPGSSRSGTSIIGGRLAGLSNRDAADYAFLIGIPVIFGAGVKILFDSSTQSLIRDYPLDLLLGVVVTAIVGLAAIHLVLGIIKKYGLKWFGAYRIALALILLTII